MKTQNIITEMYETPVVEIITVEVEKGFASSDTELEDLKDAGLYEW